MLQMERAFSIRKFRLGMLDYLSRNFVFPWKFPFGKKKIVFPFTFHPKFPDFLDKWYTTSVSPPINSIASGDQFNPIRIGENVVVS